MGKNNLMQMPTHIAEVLQNEEMILVIGGKDDKELVNNNDGLCSGVNNGNGRCTSGINNGSGLCE